MSSDPRTSRSRAAASLLPMFIAHRARDASSIAAALEQRDFELIARLGHNMRGNGISYGFPEISAIGEQLESAAMSRDVAAGRSQVSLLHAWIDRNDDGATDGSRR